MIRFAVYASPLGFLRMGYENGSIVSLQPVDAAEDAGERNDLTEAVNAQLTEYFAGKRQAFDFPVELRGTPFQQKVWAALCAIPYGETRSYREIAAAVGNPNACRAVGMANNKNPIIIAVPCHRVIGADGSLTGYACGLEKKRMLLALESANAPFDHPRA